MLPSLLSVNRDDVPTLERRVQDAAARPDQKPHARNINGAKETLQ